MMAQIKMGIKLIRYAFGIKLSAVFIVALTVIGLIIDFMLRGTTFIGVFFVSLLPMFLVQFLYSICLSNNVGASAWRKRMQTTMPALLAFLANVIVFTVIIIIKMVEIRMFPEESSVILGCLLVVAVLQILLGVYNGLCYKYFALSLIVMYILIFGCSFLGGYSMVIREESLSVGFSAPVYHSPAAVVLITYVSIVIGAVLQYVVSLVVYKKPLSKWAQGAAMRKYL